MAETTEQARSNDETPGLSKSMDAGSVPQGTSFEGNRSLNIYINASKDSGEPSVQYISDRLITKVGRCQEFWLIKKLDLVLSKKGDYVKKIKYIENLEKCTQLEHLSLGYNIIEKMEHLDHLKHLRELYLNNNRIVKIEGISTLTNLEVLDLSNNLIELLPVRTFKELQKIVTLDVSNNRIARLREVTEMRILGNLTHFSYHDNPCKDMDHAQDAAVFYLRGLLTLDGTDITPAMRTSADARYQQDEVNALNEELNTKKRLVDSVSKEKAQVISILKDKEVVEEKLRSSGKMSQKKAAELQAELECKDILLKKHMDELTRSAQKHYALEQELSMYKIDARFRDLGPPPPFNPNKTVTEIVEESGYVSKAPLYPCQQQPYSTPNNTRVLEHYDDRDYTEDVPPDEQAFLLEQQIKDKERQQKKAQQRQNNLEDEIETKNRELQEAQKKLHAFEIQNEYDLNLKAEEVEELRGALNESEREVDDLRRALNSRSEEVKVLRSHLSQVNHAEPSSPEDAHVTARLRAKERDLEHERQALEEAKAEFKRKQRELQNKSNELERVREEIKRPRVPSGQADLERAALKRELSILSQQVVDKKDKLADLSAQQEDLIGELDRLNDELFQTNELEKTREDLDKLKGELDEVEQNAEGLKDELHRTQDALRDRELENKLLKDEAARRLQEELYPESAVLMKALQAQQQQAENERPSWDERDARSSLREAKARAHNLEDENDQLRDMLEKSLNNHPQELSRSILEFLEERLPRGGEGKESDLLPLVQLLLEERGKNLPKDEGELIKLLEEMLKKQNEPININLNVTDPERKISEPAKADQSGISERFLLPSSPTLASPPSPLRSSTPGPSGSRDSGLGNKWDDDYDPAYVHMISRKAQTEGPPSVSILRSGKVKKKKKHILYSDDQQTIFQEDVIVIDARVRDSTTNTVQDTADEVLKRLGEKEAEKDRLEKERASKLRDKKQSKKLNQLFDEISLLRQGLRDATTQTMVKEGQRRLEEAIERTNSMASCGHEAELALLRANIEGAEREIATLRDMLHNGDSNHDNELMDLKIDGLGQTIKEQNKSMQGLQEAMLDLLAPRNAASRVPSEALNNRNNELREIHEIQRTLDDLQHSLKNKESTPNIIYQPAPQAPPAPNIIYHGIPQTASGIHCLGSTDAGCQTLHHQHHQCTNCTNCKHSNERELNLEAELRRVRQELADTASSQTTLRADHTGLIVECERLRSERDNFKNMIEEDKGTLRHMRAQLSETDSHLRARHEEVDRSEHRLRDMEGRIAESERSLAEHRQAEQTVVESLRSEAVNVRQSLQELHRQREGLQQEAVLAKERLQREVEREGKEKDEKQQALQESLRSIAEIREKSIAELDRKIAEREQVMSALRAEEEGCRRDLRNTSEQLSDMKRTVEKQIQISTEALSLNEAKLQQLLLECSEVKREKQGATDELEKISREAGHKKDDLRKLEQDFISLKKDKGLAEADLKTTTQKYKLIQSRVNVVKSELEGVVKEKESVKDSIYSGTEELFTDRGGGDVENTSLSAESVEQLSAELVSNKDSNREKKEKVKALDAQLENKRKEMIELKNVEQDVKGLEDKQREQQGTVEVLKREIMRLEMEREAEHSKLKDLKGEPQDISPSVTSQPLPNKGTTEAIKARQEAVQQSLVSEEERLRGVISEYSEERSGLEHTLSALQTKIDQLNQELHSKAEDRALLTDSCEQTKAHLAELELTISSKASQLDEYLNTAIKDKFSLQTDITTLTKDKEMLSLQHNQLKSNTEKLEEQHSALQQAIKHDEGVSEKVRQMVVDAERQYKDYTLLSEQTMQQINQMHSETESVNQELQRRKADFTETSAKLDLTQSALKDRQNKLHQVDKKLYSYNQKLNQSKATLETRQSEVSAVSELKTGLDKQMSALRGEIGRLEEEQKGLSETVSAEKGSLDQIRADLEVRKKQQKQDMVKFNKLLREKTKCEAEVKAMKNQSCELQSNLDKMKSEENHLSNKIHHIASDLSTKSEELKLKSQSLSTIEQSGRQTQDGLKREFEELKLRSKELDAEITNKTSYLAECAQSVREYNQLKRVLEEKEAALKDSAAEISSFKDKVNVLVKEEREEGEKSAHWKTQVKKLQKALNLQRNIATGLKKELAEEIAASQTLDIELRSQQDEHNAVLSSLEEDNIALHSKCEEQLLDIETLRLELNSTKHSLSNKQSELTEAAAERLNNTLSEDIENGLTADEVANEFYHSIAQMKREKHDMMSDLLILKPADNNADILSLRSKMDLELGKQKSAMENHQRSALRTLHNINYKIGCIEDTMSSKDINYGLNSTRDLNSTGRDQLASTLNSTRGDQLASTLNSTRGDPLASTLNSTRSQSNLNLRNTLDSTREFDLKSTLDSARDSGRDSVMSPQIDVPEVEQESWMQYVR